MSRGSSLLLALGDAVTPIAWTTPAGLRDHEAALAEWLAGPRRRPYDRPFNFPTFELGPIQRLVAEARETLPDVPDPIRAQVAAEIDAQEWAAEVIHARDDVALAEWAVAAKGLPTAESLAEATRTAALLPAAPPTTGMLVDTSMVQLRMEGTLAAFGLTDWKVEISPNMSANASVIGSRKLLRIRGAVPSPELDRLVVHEIGGHVLRWANAMAQPFEWAAITLGDPVPTEEGLAALLEEQLATNSDSTQRSYAIRALAVAAGQHLGLEDLAIYLTEYLDDSSAARLALRIRRGLKHPSSIGCLTKDHGYWTGLLACRDLLNRAPEAVDLLRATKWPMGMLELSHELAEQGLLVAPRHLPLADKLLMSAS